MWPGWVSSRYQATATEHEGVGDPIGHRVEERPPHARPARRLGQGPVEQVGHGRGDQQDQAQTQAAGGDGPRRRHGEDQAQRGQVVRGDAGPLEGASDRLDYSVDAGTETSVKHLDNGSSAPDPAGKKGEVPAW